MVCTANDLQEWKDFPKGLRVLLMDGDTDSAADIRSKLEQMEYIVYTYCNDNEALTAISSKPESFHIAIVEVSTSNCDGSFRFLEAAKGLPTIMISNIHCLNTMMKCIALGAVEFMQKPLSKEKLQNIWQHVVHKAFNSGGNGSSNFQKPIKDSVETEDRTKISTKTEDQYHAQEDGHEKLPGSDKYPAPSTPQLEQGARLMDDGDCQDQTNNSVDKVNRETVEQDGESKFVETTCENLRGEDSLHMGQTPSLEEKSIIKEEEDFVDGSKVEFSMSPYSHNGEGFRDIHGDAKKAAKECSLSNSSGLRANRKKMKVDWTTALHKKFVKAVEQLGVDQAIPSRILELMKVEGLTRHNVASHLQKYRMQKRHILPKEEGSRWQNQRDSLKKSYYPLKPIMAFPPHHSNHALQMPHAYPIWGQPSGCPAGVPMWGPRCYPPWQTPETEHWWKPYAGVMHADAWGCPVMPPPHGSYVPYPQHVMGTHDTYAVDNSYGMRPSSFDFQPEEEVIDKVMGEAMSKPWLPLPLGLKPPSTESVLSELSRQGISTVPPHINGSRHF